MKFLHLADLHLGKRLNDVDLLTDQEYALKQALQIAEKVDGVLIAGDVYDKSSPSAEAMMAFDRFITQLVKMKKKVFIIPGNHDSNERISYFSDLIKDKDVYVANEFKGTIENIQLKDEYGELNIHLFPYIKPTYVKKFYPEEGIRTYEEAVKCVLDHSDINTDKRNILLLHQFITGSERSESEEVAVGGLDNIDASVFNSFDYVALGHIHKPQHISRETLRYSGSLLKYSFSEAEQKKSFCIVDVKEKGNITIEKVPIQFLHDVRVVEGLYDDIMKMNYSEDYVRVILHDEEVYPDARIRLLSVFPNMMKFTVENSKSRYDKDVIAEEEFENKNVLELFSDFYRLQNNNVEPNKAHLELLEDVLKKLEGTK